MLKKITASNGDEFTFVCEWRNKRNGFAHDCTVYRGTYEMRKESCHYLNRTWESYTYQSVMRDAMHELINEQKNRGISDYKTQNGVRRMTQEQKDAMTANDPTIKIYQEILDQL